MNNNFDPMTGRPIVNNEQSQLQQNYNNLNQNNNYNFNNNENKKNNNKMIIGVIIVAIVIGIAIFGFNKLTNKQETEGPFLMTVEEVTSDFNKGLVIASGTISRGTVHVNDEVAVIGPYDEIKRVTIGEIWISDNSVEMASAGDTVEFVLKGATRRDVYSGMLLSKPDVFRPASEFTADLYVYKTEEGGRHTPFFQNYRPPFYFRGEYITGLITLPDDVERVNPGDSVKITVKLEEKVAMDIGMEFIIREGGRIIAKGTITSLLD